MAIRQFALKLNNQSIQTGDISLEELVDNSSPADFTLSNVEGTPNDELDLITSQNGVPRSHKFAASVSGGVARVTLSSANLSTVFGDAKQGDWDYIEVRWTMGKVNFPAASQFEMIQNSTVYDFAGWPPIK
jgi:hypothetical protein